MVKASPAVLAVAGDGIRLVVSAYDNHVRVLSVGFPERRLRRAVALDGEEVSETRLSSTSITMIVCSSRLSAIEESTVTAYPILCRIDDATEPNVACRAVRCIFRAGSNPVSVAP